MGTTPITVKNGDLSWSIDLEVPDGWGEPETLEDRVRFTHESGFVYDICITDLPDWPPSKIREEFTADLPADIQIHQSRVAVGAEFRRYYLGYLPAGVAAPANVLEVLTAIEDAVVAAQQ